MTLLDLRRYAIRQGMRIHFTLEPAGECIVNEHGVLQIPSLRGTPSFTLDATLGSVEEFTLAPVRESAKRQRISRQELESLLGEAPRAAASHAQED